MNNICVLVGRLTKKPELKKTSNDKSISELSIAIQNGKDDTTFVTISVFGQIAETVTRYCDKGDMIGTQAILKNHNWEDKEGKRHYDYQFIANKISFLSTKKEKKENEIKEMENKYGSQYDGIELEDADLPF